VGFLAVKLGITAYIVPFMFVYSGALLLRGDWREVLVAIPTAMLGVWALSRGVQDRSVHGVWRIIYVLAAVVLIKPGIYTDMLGIGLIAVAFLGQRHLALARQPS
jgi:TRAP-type uncharacterized transport system fused permease subunit